MSGTVKGWDLRILERITEERRRSAPVEPFGISAISAIAENEVGETIRRNAGILTQEASNILLEPSQPMIAVFSGPVDSRVCPLCAALVGQRVRTDSPEYRTYSPPLHINCRHYWLYMHPDTPGAREDFTPPDPELVEQIRRLMFVFEDILLVNDKGIQSLLKEVENCEEQEALEDF